MLRAPLARAILYSLCICGFGQRGHVMRKGEAIDGRGQREGTRADHWMGIQATGGALPSRARVCKGEAGHFEAERELEE